MFLHVVEAMTSFIQKLNRLASLITALATVVLAFITAYYAYSNAQYVRLMEQSVLLQQTPEVDGVLSVFNSDKLIIENSGPQPVVAIKVWWTAYLHGRPGAPPVMTLFYLQPTAWSPAWWDIPRLAVGKPESKSLSEIIQNIGHNVDVTIKDSERNPGYTRQPPIQWWTRLVFTIEYRREVDRKRYQFYVTGVLLKDSQKGTYFLSTTPFAPEPNTPELLVS